MRISNGQLLLSLAALMMLAGCATIGPPQPPSLELPKPPSDLRAVRKGDHVILTWSIPTLTTDRQNVRSPGATRICRGSDSRLSDCETSVGELPPPKQFAVPQKSQGQKIPTSYTDTLPAERDASASITYAVQVLNSSGRGAGLSNQIHVSLAPTSPPPQDFSARVTAEGVVLTWKAAATSQQLPTRYLCRVYRRLDETLRSILIGEVPLTGTTDHTLTDTSIEWEKTYDYRADIVTVFPREGTTEGQVEGDDTAEIRVLTHDVFPPSVPAGLQAVFSGPGQTPFVDLIWAPVTDVDLAGYYVYRHEEGAPPEKLNAEPIKTPAYRDQNISSGKAYVYSVSAVDVRDNESARSEEASERVP